MDPKRNHRILLVDDNPAIHQDFRKILGGASGEDTEVDALLEEFLGAESSGASPSTEMLDLKFELTSAHQGEEALDLVRQAQVDGKPFAMAFVDVRMPPGWDGVKTLSELWKVDPQMQAVVCTAYSDYSYADMLRQLGQSDRLLILKKPFDPIEVQQLAGALVEKWNVSQEHTRALEEIRSYAASLETVNLALTSDKAMSQAFNQTKTDFIVEAGRALELPARRILSGIQSASELTGTAEELNELAPDAAGMLSLIGQVIDLAELEAGRFATTHAECQLSQTLDSVEAACTEAAQLLGRTVALTRDPQLPQSGQLDQARTVDIARHLVLGALELCRDEQQLTLEARLETTGGFGLPKLCLEILLPGCRFNGDQKREMFEPFRTEGVLLHLPLARQIARFLHADLSLEDRGDDTRLVLKLDAGFAKAEEQRPAA